MRLSAALCVRSPGLPKASGRRPLVLAGPPQGRGGAVSGGGAWGRGEEAGGVLDQGPSWSGRRRSLGFGRKGVIKNKLPKSFRVENSTKWKAARDL